MIKKVLIAEDQECANMSLQKALEELGITDIDYVYYCDDALASIQRSKHSNESYDLLITDLSFEEDGRLQKITGGKELIQAARQVQPDLRVLVFSASREAATIETLDKTLDADGYVRKARNDAKELKEAIDKISKNQRHFPRYIIDLVKQKNAHDFTRFDIAVISLLAQGTLQKDIPAHLQKSGIKPSGLSSVEKRLNLMKETFDFSKNEQLVAYCKDMGII
ncbi:response regulator [Pinibacter aurantiacus]|uniref:Response regulator n=1 Tax=Pinibacter aurantiacus TaxID=2851599 RepID=A0A9E2W9M5_9BACT|nr:response regulator [Pinibacter aurantiacus]MBV4359927.1 response regulator [Pinibacter aurantiacus]